MFLANPKMMSEMILLHITTCLLLIWFFCLHPSESWAEIVRCLKNAIPSNWMDLWVPVILTLCHRFAISSSISCHIWRQLRRSQPDTNLGCLSRNTLHSWPFPYIYYLIVGHIYVVIFFSIETLPQQLKIHFHLASLKFPKYIFIFSLTVNSVQPKCYFKIF